jgi:hypothetical protein
MKDSAEAERSISGVMFCREGAKPQSKISLSIMPGHTNQCVIFLFT